MEKTKLTPAEVRKTLETASYLQLLAEGEFSDPYLLSVAVEDTTNTFEFSEVRDWIYEYEYESHEEAWHLTNPMNADTWIEENSVSIISIEDRDYLLAQVDGETKAVFRVLYPWELEEGEEL